MDNKAVETAVRLYYQAEAINKKRVKIVNTWPLNSEEMKAYRERTRQ